MGDIDTLPFDKPEDCNKRIDYDFSVAAMLGHVDQMGSVDLRSVFDDLYCGVENGFLDAKKAWETFDYMKSLTEL